MENNTLKTIGQHLLALFGYSILSFYSGMGSFAQAFFLFFHVLICIDKAYNDELGFKHQEHILSLFIVLLIGFGICTQMPFPAK
jgi:hypothetical protein